MATVELTRKQLLTVVQQLSDEDRATLLKELLRCPSREEAVAAAAKLRPKYRLPAREQRRLTHLLRKGQEQELADSERGELNSLLEDVDRRNLEMARELIASFGVSTTR